MDIPEITYKAGKGHNKEGIKAENVTLCYYFLNRVFIGCRFELVHLVLLRPFLRVIIILLHLLLRGSNIIININFNVNFNINFGVNFSF